MADRYDELVAIRQQAAHQRMVQGLQNQRQANWNDYCQALSENDMDKAAWAEAEYLKTTKDLAELGGHQQQQQPAQQQPQQQFTEVQMGILREFPGIWHDPKKRAEAIAKNKDLVEQGYDPNSAEYDNAMRIGLGLIDADGSEALEIASPDTALAAVNNSRIAREHGPVTTDEYNTGVRRLIENKKIGLYSQK